ncbi:MAG: hypothetical protein H6603_08130 [Flavobacteriales bacterium]|nr:hypothetical protein [Flavobacteriales bacterium]
MYTLGTNGGLRLGYQDVSAVLLKNGEIVASIEEEPVIGEKHAAGRLSEKSVVDVLYLTRITMNEVDVVATHGSTWGDDVEGKLKAYLLHRFRYVPQIERHHHHDCHAASAFYGSGFREPLTVTADVSGDCLARYDLMRWLREPVWVAYDKCFNCGH